LAVSGGIGRVFENRNYRFFWTGQLLLNVGNWVYRVSAAWLCWELEHSTAWLGLIAAGTTLPSLVLGPLAGTISDRYGHRRQLMTSSAVSLVSTLIAGILTVMGWMTIEILFAVSLLGGTTRAFNVPARNALVPNLVPRDIMSSAIAINSATYQGSNFVGPAVAGILISSVGVAPSFFVYSAGVACALVTLALVKVAPHPPRTGRQRSLIGDLADGLTYTARHTGIRAVMLMSTITALLVAPYQDMLAGVSATVFGRGASGLAILASSAGLGALMGGLFIAWRGRIEGLVRIQGLAVLGAIVGLAIFSLSQIFVLSCAAVWMIGLCMVMGSTSGDSLTQNAVDPTMRARVTAVQAMISVGMPSLGAVIIGWAGTIWGIQLPFTIAAGLAFCMWIVLSRIVRKQRALLERSRELATAGT
jgi:MFS family permease